MSGHEATTATPLANRPTALPMRRTDDVGWAQNIAFHVLSRRKDKSFSKSQRNLSTFSCKNRAIPKIVKLVYPIATSSTIIRTKPMAK
jgi:hypothetical protein